MFDELLGAIGFGSDPMATALQHQLTDEDLERMAFEARQSGNGAALNKIAEMRQRYGYSQQREPLLSEAMAQHNRLSQGPTAFNPYTRINDVLGP